MLAKGSGDQFKRNKYYKTEVADLEKFTASWVITKELIIETGIIEM